MAENPVARRRSYQVSLRSLLWIAITIALALALHATRSENRKLHQEIHFLKRCYQHLAVEQAQIRELTDEINTSGKNGQMAAAEYDRLMRIIKEGRAREEYLRATNPNSTPNQ